MRGNEDGVGAGIHSFLDSSETVREDLFVTNKLLPGDESMGEAAKDYAATIEALEALAWGGRNPMETS